MLWTRCRPSQRALSATKPQLACHDATEEEENSPIEFLQMNQAQDRVLMASISEVREGGYQDQSCESVYRCTS